MPKKKDSERPHAGEICPIFVSYKTNEIECKAHLTDAHTTILRYTNRDYAEFQHRQYCCENYKYCEQYRSYQHFRWLDD